MRGLCLGILWLVLAAGLSAQGRTPPVTVSAASSLGRVLEAIAAQYLAKTGEPVALNVAASNTLARQIRAGAPVDLFLSADEQQMDTVAEQLVDGTRIALLTNQLAVAVPADRPVTLRVARDLLGASVRRVAVGDPDAVPVGVYARAYLDKLGLWAALRPKLVPVGSARLALSAVEQGAADAAIVYRTDVADSRRARLAYVVPVAATTSSFRA